MMHSSVGMNMEDLKVWLNVERYLHDLNPVYILVTE